jgi:hypothetical protein
LSRPIDVIRCFHNAFRRDISQIDNVIFRTAPDGRNLTPVLNRLHAMNELLDYHARGEGVAVFPAMDKVAPQVASACLMDHRELDSMVNDLETIRTTLIL